MIGQARENLVTNGFGGSFEFMGCNILSGLVYRKLDIYDYMGRHSRRGE